MYVIQNTILTGVMMMVVQIELAQSLSPYTFFKDGIGINLITQGNGERCKPAHELTLRYSMGFHPDTLLDQSNSNFTFILGEREGLKGWDLALQHLHIGDSAVCIIPDSLAYRGQKIGRYQTQRPLILNVKLIGQRPVYFDIPKHNRDSIRVGAGIKKIILKPGKNTVQAYHYVDFTITGYIKTTEGYRRRFIQGSNTQLGLNVQLGTKNFIEALDKTLLSMKTGEKAHVIIEPYAGLQNDKKQAGIPPNSRLFFDIELHSTINPFKHLALKDTITKIPGFYCVVNGEKRKNILRQVLPEDEQIISTQGYYFKLDSNGNGIITSNSYITGRPFIFRTRSSLFHAAFINGFKHLQFGDEVLLIYDSVPAANGFEKQGMYLESVRFTPFPFYKEDTLLRQKQNRVTYQDVVRTDNPLSVEAQDTISIRFTGYYKTDNGNRRIFDSSMDLQRGFTFVLNATSIIPGLKDGIIGMRSGSKRIIYVPYSLAYGTEGLPKRGIPPKTNLIFDVEVLHISKHKL